VRSAQSTLAVEVDRDGEMVRIRLTGDLDVTSSPLLQTVVDQALAGRRRACKLLALDMSGVAFADASGLTPILMARGMLARHGGRVELWHCRRGVLRLLRILDLDELCAHEPA
jgi:anti-sigma B factor antagonist